jgi:dephospho-CoA kinase
MCDVNILVTAPIEQKINRIMLRDDITKEAVLARMDKQLADADKMKLADELIENTENHSLILQVLALHQKFLNQK